MTSQGTSTPRARSQVGRARAPRRRRVLLGYAAAATGALTLALGAVATVGPAASATQAKGHDPAFLEGANVTGYGEILTNSKGFSVYALSNSAGDKLVCSGTCLTFWPPVLVSSSTKSVTLGAGVTGEVGFVKRSTTTKQVTFDGYPLYLFVKDTASHQTHGEGVVAFGGTWELFRASTLIAPGSSSKGTSGTTTTTTKSGY